MRKIVVQLLFIFLVFSVVSAHADKVKDYVPGEFVVKISGKNLDRLGEFNSLCPTVFTEAGNPDDACYFTMCRFSDMILKQNETATTALLLKDVLHDIRITKVRPKDV